MATVFTLSGNCKPMPCPSWQEFVGPLQTFVVFNHYRTTCIINFQAVQEYKLAPEFLSDGILFTTPIVCWPLSMSLGAWWWQFLICWKCWFDRSCHGNQRFLPCWNFLWIKLCPKPDRSHLFVRLLHKNQTTLNGSNILTIPNGGYTEPVRKNPSQGSADRVGALEKHGIWQEVYGHLAHLTTSISQFCKSNINWALRTPCGTIWVTAYQAIQWDRRQRQNEVQSHQ